MKKERKVEIGRRLEGAVGRRVEGKREGIREDAEGRGGMRRQRGEVREIRRRKRKREGARENEESRPELDERYRK